MTGWAWPVDLRVRLVEEPLPAAEVEPVVTHVLTEAAWTSRTRSPSR
jgi:hypothetical protein